MVLRAIGSAFVLKDTRFRKNKSCLYYVNNNTVFHIEQFVKCHLFTANILLVSVEQSLIDI